MSNTKQVTLSLAGRNYPLEVISKDEESLVEQMEKDLKKRYLDISSAYPNMDVQDRLAILIIGLLTEKVENIADDASETEHCDKLQGLVDKIEAHLKN